MKKTGDLQKAQKVLDYWYAIEFLAQDKYDDMWETRVKLKKAQEDFAGGRLRNKSIWSYREIGSNDSIYDIVSGDAVSCGMKKWGNITVYIGKMKREACIACIAKLLPAGREEERPEKTYDNIAWASIQIAPDGTYVNQSLSLSPMIWAVKQIKNGRGRLSENIDEKQYRITVDEIENQFFATKELKQEIQDPKNQEDEYLQKFRPDAVTADTIKSLYNYILNHFVRENIETAQAGPEYQEIYGLHFQLFADEKSRSKLDEDNYLGLSHDYFSDDLKFVLETIKDGAIPSDDLIRYISCWGEEGGSNKIDLVHPGDRKEFFRQVSEILEVGNAPLGKWPSKYMPAFMQQIAVNLFIRKGASQLYGINGNIFSVNGPPGTGKTTLLKEIVVSNMIERAILLAEYKDPDDAFERRLFLHGEKQDHAYSAFVRGWYQLKDERINDYSILVTSCNNAAVENVSKELPLAAGILNDLMPAPDDTEQYADMLREVRDLFDPEKSQSYEMINRKKCRDVYFTEYAKALLGKESIWGLIAAPLGKKSNITAFYSNVLNPLYWDFYPGKDFKELRLDKYKQAKEEFENQLSAVNRLQGELKEICTLVRQRTKSALELEEIIKCLPEKRAENKALINAEELNLEKLRKTLEDKENELAFALDKRNQLQELIAEIVRESGVKLAEKREWLEKEAAAIGATGIFDKLFNKKKAAANELLAAEYHEEALKAGAEAQRLDGCASQLSQSLQEAQNEFENSVGEKEGVETDIADRKRRISEKKRIISELESRIENIKKELSAMDFTYLHKVREFTRDQSVDAGLILDDAFISRLLSRDSRESTDSQVANPWFTKRYNIEREKLFFYAAKLNKEFVLSSKSCRDNFKTLGHYWGLLRGDDKERVMFHKEDKERIAGALYQTLFLLVPVLSSTFASLGTFLRDAKQPGVIGTLIVDEAGQAQPQMAVGALYRSRKAMIVGDPKQVEPVVTDDLNLLKRTFDDKELMKYKSKNVSVQTFADKLNSFGTYLENGTDTQNWVGCPLLVHRRCISPMYDISNELSYNVMMKLQTREPDEKKKESFVYEKSQWIQVAGIEKGGKNHFVEEQARKTCEILEAAFSKSENPSLFIISPFTSVVSGMKAYLRAYKKKTACTNLAKCEPDWMNKNIGTVHTFQGKEAGEVIFLLGCDKSREAGGAIQWVNDNIVNVAVTRAKFRLYIIGDEEAWKTSSCVSKAKTILDTFALRKIKDILDRQLPEAEETKALAAASVSLPPITAFKMDATEEENGRLDYSIDTSCLLQELDQSFITADLSEAQLQKFGFQTMEDLKELSAGVKDNLVLGMKIFYLLSPVYKVNNRLDASCCAILFCKAMELQMKDCFEESLKAVFPDIKIKGYGKGRGMVALRDAKPAELTLGAFRKILNAQNAELVRIMEHKGRKEYGSQWWEAFEARLSACTEKRNKCCHSGLFTWKDQSYLLADMFMIDSKNTKIRLEGIMFASEVGKKLIPG